MPRGRRNGDGQLVGAAAATAEAAAAGLPNPYEPPPPPKAYPEEVKVQVLGLLSDGMTMSGIEKMSGMPNAATIRYWRRHDPAFAEAFARAHEEMATSLLHRAVDAADAAKDKDTASSGRVKADTFLKVAAMLDPQRYGPKQPGGRALSVTINTNIGGPADNRSDGAYTITIEADE